MLNSLFARNLFGSDECEGFILFSFVFIISIYLILYKYNFII